LLLVLVVLLQPFCQLSLLLLLLFVAACWACFLRCWMLWWSSNATARQQSSSRTGSGAGRQVDGRMMADWKGGGR
jgi:hypothetical protein